MDRISATEVLEGLTAHYPGVEFRVEFLERGFDDPQDHHTIEVLALMPDGERFRTVYFGEPEGLAEHVWVNVVGFWL